MAEGGREEMWEVKAEEDGMSVTSDIVGVNVCLSWIFFVRLFKV